MQAYSLDLRQRIVDALAQGATINETAQRFAVSTASVKRYQRQRRQTGNLTPKPWPGRAPKIKKEQEGDLRALVAKKTDWTLQSLCDAWKAHYDAEVALDLMHRTLARLRITYKKRAVSLPSATRPSARHLSRP
jgi:transposase